MLQRDNTTTTQHESGACTAQMGGLCADRPTQGVATEGGHYLKVHNVGWPPRIGNDPDRLLCVLSGQTCKVPRVIVSLLLAPHNHLLPILFLVCRGPQQLFQVETVVLDGGKERPTWK
jgi:hypothetical protein